MQIINLDLNTAVLVGGMPEAYNCIKECFDTLASVNTLLESMDTWDPSVCPDEEVWESTQILNCESTLSALNTPGIDTYKLGALSKFPILFERLEHFQFYRLQLSDYLEPIVDAFISLSDEEKETIKELCTKILSQLSYFTFFEFRFDVLAVAEQNNTEQMVYEAIDYYCGKDGKEVMYLLDFILDMYNKYKITLPSTVLDDDTIDKFYYITGMYSYHILDHLDSLDLQVIKDIANEVVSVEDVVAKLNPDRGEVMKLDLF